MRAESLLSLNLQVHVTVTARNRGMRTQLQWIVKLLQSLLQNSDLSLVTVLVFKQQVKRNGVKRRLIL